MGLGNAGILGDREGPFQLHHQFTFTYLTFSRSQDPEEGREKDYDGQQTVLHRASG